VNAAYNPTGSTGNFFATPPASGLIAVDPSVTAATLKATDTGSAGSNELAIAVSSVASTNYSTTSGDAISGTPAGFYASVVSGLGSQISTSTSNLANQQLVASSVSEQRDSVSGVSLDEETTDLLSYQRAFEASARFVTTMDDLLNTVVNQMGVTN
jgi:flagellar hook-associated protein 1 FlgK